MIIDINIRFNNHLQDVTGTSNLVFANFSTLYFSDGSQAEATPVDNLSWQWSLVDAHGNKVLLSTEFEVKPSLIPTLLCNGYFRIRCEVTDNDTGFIWGRTEPCFLLFSNWSTTNNLCTPIFIPPGGQYNLDIWQENAGLLMSQGSATHSRGQWLIGGKVGDLDKNGSVNVQDLLLLLSKFGD